MARNSRLDVPGSWHHVMNRGIARRTAFETRSDVRSFLARAARAVRRGEIEVHAFCVMTTHFHLLVRSPNGQLSEAMRRIQNEYVRRFNRSRRRDGPLFRGRFRSMPVDSLTYRRTLVRYIDANPVSAGIAPSPHGYPHGSARLYTSHSGPAWLKRHWIEGSVRDATRRAYDGRGYMEVFGGALPTRLRDLVELRIERGRSGPDPLDDLVSATPHELVSLMRHRARLADGTRPGLAACDPCSVSEAVERGRELSGSWIIHPGQKPVDAWLQVHASLLCDLCGLTASQVGRRLSRSESGVGKLRARHRARMQEDEAYAERVGGLVLFALEACGVRPGARTVVELS